MLQEGERRLQAVKRYLDDSTLIVRQLEQEATRLESTLVRMVDDYRDEYRQVRETKGPAFWEDDEPRLDREVPFDLDNFVQIEDSEINNLRALTDLVEQIKRKLVTEG